MNALIIAAAGATASFIATRPGWTRWQRRLTGTLLGAIALMLAREVPGRARV